MRSRTTAVLVLAASFLAGAFASVGAMRLLDDEGDGYSATGRPPFPDGPGGRRPGGTGGLLDGYPGYRELARIRVTERMARELGLTEEQRDAIDEAMERRRARAQATMQEVLPRLELGLDSLNAEIDQLLTEEQREGFRDFRRRDRARFRREGGPWFRRPGREMRH